MPKITRFMICKLVLTFVFSFLSVNSFAQEPVETIRYDISLMGHSEYQDMGSVGFRGKKANKIIFKTDVVGLKDTETIYSDPDTYLPIKVERDITMWLHKENLIEEYSSSTNSLKIFKFQGGKKTDEYNFKGKGPIHNAILLPFSLRKVPDLKVGWNMIIRLPDEILVELIGVEMITVPAGAFEAFHFTSIPHKFDIWITTDSLRLPIKIQGAGVFSYTMLMSKHSIKGKVEKKD